MQSASSLTVVTLVLSLDTRTIVIISMDSALTLLAGGKTALFSRQLHGHSSCIGSLLNTMADVAVIVVVNVITQM